MPRKEKTAKAADLGIRIGRNIKIARTRQGITQSQLAETLDIESVTISRIETGAQLPAIDRLEQIARTLKVSLSTLLADSSKSGAFGEMLNEVAKDLPVRERDFIYSFIVSYAQHWRTTNKKA